ncbi:MAG: alpha/beta fold hydrolase [Balneolales bacterium]
MLLLNGLDTLQLKTIFHEPYLAGVRPDFRSFSPDQNRVYFSWNDSSKSNLHTYSVSLDGRNTQHHQEDSETRAVIAPDGRQWVYLNQGRLWLDGSRYDEPRILLETEFIISDLHWLDDNKTIYFIMNKNVWSLNQDPFTLRQLSNWDYSDNQYIHIRLLAVTGNGKFAVLQQSDTSGYLDILFPEYVDTLVRDGTTRRGQSLISLFLLDIRSRERHLLFDGEWTISNHSISASNTFFAVDRIDHAMKRREIIRYHINEGQNKQENNSNSPKRRNEIGHEEHSQKEESASGYTGHFSPGFISVDTLLIKTTEGWVYPDHHTFSFAPESDQLLFTSEMDGWNHIYTVDADQNRPQQRTRGHFEVPWADWQSAHSILYASNEKDPGERRIYRLDLSNNSVRELTSEEAYRNNFFLNRDRTHLVYEKTGWNQPADLHVLDVQSRHPSETRITRSVPDRFLNIDWQQPEYVRFMSRDGQTPLSMNILRPIDFNPEKNYPVIVFVHGAGSLQNVFKGWSEYYAREYMFHQFLNQHDYVVIEVDYRHSTGYGRAFREDVTNWMGHYELRDIIDGLDYVENNGGYIDRNRVGIYGGSYGGFMALYAVSRSPENFQAAAALRAVTNWENYYYANPWYTRPRLGVPDEQPEHYERSSPITYADSLQRPVILFHGLMDDNVGFQDAMQYVNQLIASGNTHFDLMVYPSERHSFESPESWYDEYKRIFHFFEGHLK